MSYRMNIGKELSQIKYCKTIDEVIAFLKDHNLEFDHWYFKGNTSEFTNNQIYIVANYTDPENNVFIQITFNL